MYGGDWYFQSDTPGEIDSQGITDSLLNLYADKGIDFVFYDWYGFDSVGPGATLGSPYNYLLSGDRIIQAKITNGLLYHKLSPNAAKVKYAVNIVADWFAATTKSGAQWGYQTEHATAIRALFDDPNYQRHKGLPIVGLFDANYTAPAPDSTTFLSHWAAIKAILGPCWLILTDNPAGTTLLTNFAAHAKTNYGNAGGPPAGAVAGRNAYSIYQNGDLNVSFGNDARALKATTVSLTGSDVRPRGGNPAYCDYPAHDDLLATLRGSVPLTSTGRDVSELVILNTADEFDEGEIADPTRDNGTEVLDAIARWKGRLDLSTGRDGFGTTAFGAGTYTYSMSLSTKYWTKTGTWTTGAGIDLAYQNEEQRSSTTGDTAVLVKAFTRIEIRGKRGPAQGRFTISIDGGAATTVDTGGSAADDVSFFTASGLSYANHTVTITILGDHVVGSGNQVALQRAKITYLPT